MTPKQIARLKAENRALRAELDRLARMVAQIARLGLDPKPDSQGTLRLERRRVNSVGHSTIKTRRALHGRK